MFHELQFDFQFNRNDEFFPILRVEKKDTFFSKLRSIKIQPFWLNKKRISTEKIERINGNLFNKWDKITT